MSIAEEHLADLRASGLTDETIATAGVWSASTLEASGIFGRSLECGALALPYPGERSRIR